MGLRGSNGMKKMIVKLLMLIGLAMLGTSFVDSAEASEMYRLYNPNTSEHFYTYSVGERDNIVLYNWQYEGIGWDSPSSGRPVYRLYNSKLDDHHYTLDAGERDNLVRNFGWQNEGVGWYSDVNFGSPVYRLYNSRLKSGQHHYTLSTSERNNLIRNYGWKDEGVGFYGAVNNNRDNSYSSVQRVIPFINQYSAGAPMGCEAAALLQGLQAKGRATTYNLASFLREMPISPNKNPNNGFAGTPYSYLTDGTYQSIFPAPLASWGSKYGNVSNISGSSLETLKQEIRNGNPIVAYVTYDFATPVYAKYFWGVGIDNAHVLSVFGYNNNTRKWLVSDPAKGKYWVSYDRFDVTYTAMKYAVVIR